MDRLHRKYDWRVPRYTSYPTAPHFSADVDADTYAGWLSSLPAETPLSLYFHVPYCDTLCWFCGCHTKIVNRYQPVANYVDVLVREVDLIGDLLGPDRTAVHLHFGGGSPTILKPQDLQRLGVALHAHFRFAPGAEVAVEIDPRGLGDAVIAAMAAIGVNRVSIGVQDVNPIVQRAINRVQTKEETSLAVERLRAAGVPGLNVDLMYGLPHQSLDDMLRTVDAVLDLEPDRIALFGYAHVPFMKTHQRLIPEEALPDAELRLAQAEAAAARLVEAGYRRIGLDHFARADDGLMEALKEGELRRNFQGYTDDGGGALIGFGASAIGTLPQGYVQNAVPIHAYRRAIESGRPATARGIALAADDRLRARIIESLMCDLAVDLEDIAKTEPEAKTNFGDELCRLAEMETDGLVSLTGSRLEVSETGRPFVRCVASVFDRYLASGAGRHAQAV